MAREEGRGHGNEGNLDLVRRGYEAFNAGDAEGLKAIMAADAAHIVPGKSELSGAHKGIDNILTLYAALGERSNGTLSIDLEDVVSDGGDRVVAIQTLRAKREGKTLEAREALLFTISAGRVVEVQDFFPDIDANDSFWA